MLYFVPCSSFESTVCHVTGIEIRLSHTAGLLSLLQENQLKKNPQQQVFYRMIQFLLRWNWLTCGVIRRASFARITSTVFNLFYLDHLYRNMHTTWMFLFRLIMINIY